LSWLRTIAGAVKSARERAGLTQRALADAAGVDRGQIANLESHADPESKSRTTELPRVGLLVRLSFALGKAPVELLYPALPYGPVEVWPGMEVSSLYALEWFSGSRAIVGDSDEYTVSTISDNLLALSREYERLRDAETHATGELLRLRSGRPVPEGYLFTEDQLEGMIRQYTVKQYELGRRIQEMGGTVRA
jgi:transcriptional regulator with XRE-family HTH domain